MPTPSLRARALILGSAATLAVAGFVAAQAVPSSTPVHVAASAPESDEATPTTLEETTTTAAPVVTTTTVAPATVTTVLKRLTTTTVVPAEAAVVHTRPTTPTVDCNITWTMWAQGDNTTGPMIVFVMNVPAWASAYNSTAKFTPPDPYHNGQPGTMQPKSVRIDDTGRGQANYILDRNMVGETASIGWSATVVDPQTDVAHIENCNAVTFTIPPPPPGKYS